MVGPIDPGSFNFLGLAPPAPGDAAVREGAQQDRVTAPVATGGSADLVELSREAQDASRAVRPTPDNPQGAQARSAEPRGSVDGLERQAPQPAPPSPEPQPSLHFTVNRELGQILAQVVDRTTGELIRAVPPDRRVRIAEQLAKTRETLFRSGEHLDAEA